MADETESVNIKVPTGETVSAVVPKGMPDAAIKTSLMAKHPELFHTNAPGTESQALAMPPAAPVPNVKMQTSVLPSVARTAINTLPVAAGTVGGIVGGTAGVAAGGIGAFAGAPLGAAAGVAATNPIRQAVLRKAFGDQESPAPSSSAGIKETAIGSGVAGSLEIPGALLTGYGSILLKQLGAAKSSQQVGDVVKAFEQQSPVAFSRGGFTKGLTDANEALSRQLGPRLAAAQGTANIDAIALPMRAEARIADMAVPGTAKNVEGTITAAKYSAGIKGNTATAQQLADFNNYLREVKKVYTAAPSANVSATSNPILLKVDQAVRQNLRQLAPEAADVYDKMTDVHAALSAIKTFNPGTIKSAAITAATHPAITAGLSPLAIPAAYAAEELAKPAINKVKGMIP